MSGTILVWEYNDNKSQRKNKSKMRKQALREYENEEENIPTYG